ncbi:MAG: hypothetical protein QXI12_10970 [Candidatus Methanomethyliaceae archaeon]
MGSTTHPHPRRLRRLTKRGTKGQANVITTLVMILVFLVFFTGFMSFWRLMTVDTAIQGAAHYAITSMESEGCYTQSLDQGLAQYLTDYGIDPSYVGVSVSTGNTPTQYGYPVSVSITATVPMWVLDNSVLWRMNAQAEAAGASAYIPGNGQPAPVCTSPTFQDGASPTGSYKPVFGGA